MALKIYYSWQSMVWYDSSGWKRQRSPKEREHISLLLSGPPILMVLERTVLDILWLETPEH